jgi:hypothetical protein
MLELEICCVCLEEISFDLCRDLKCCNKNIHIKCLLELFFYKNKDYSLTFKDQCPLCRQLIQIKFTIPEILVICHLYKDTFNQYKHLIKTYITNHPLKYELPKIYIKEFIDDNKALALFTVLFDTYPYDY